MTIDVFELSSYRHPSTALFLARLAAVDFADRYDALCAAHPKRGNDVPVADRHAALANTGRKWVYRKRERLWAYREVATFPKYCGLGLDVRIDARVELSLLFATPLGHLSGPFPRFVKQLRQLTDPQYRHPSQNPAPRIERDADLPAILTECLALYDLMAQSINQEVWWSPASILAPAA